MAGTTKYHVNKETGRANICRATKKGCPLGADTPHFDGKEEAKAYIEKEAQEKGEMFTKVSKKLQIIIPMIITILKE